MIITEFILIIGGIVAVVAAIFTVILYISTTKKTTVTLTFSNGKNKIECKIGAKIPLHFLLKNTGNTVAHNIEATVYYPKGIKPGTRDNTQPEKVEYFMHPDERIVLRVKSLPSRSNPITRHTSSVKLNKTGTYEFQYKIIGEKVKKQEGKLLARAKT